MFKALLISALIKTIASVPPSGVPDNLNEDIKSLKYTTKALAIQLEKWNNIFLGSLEPRIASSASVLASIDSNINNLQERAHVWDTFQLHVSAWNDQLATLDRKMDIISKGQEKLILLDAKVNSMISIDYKLDGMLKKLENIQENLPGLDVGNHKNSHDSLFGEFATRGILSTIKSVEKKLDKLALSQQNAIIKTKGNEDKPKLTIKCNTPRVVEEMLNDISSKVDIIFDKISIKEEDSEYDTEYVEIAPDSSGDIPLELKQNNEQKLFKKAMKRINQPCKQISQGIEDLLNSVLRIENTSRVILDKENTNFEKLLSQCNTLKNTDELQINVPTNLEKIDKHIIDFNTNLDKILGSYFSEQRAYLESIFLKYLPKTNNCLNPIITTPKTISFHDLEVTEPNVGINISNDYKNVSFAVNKLSCEDLDNDNESGIYIFGNDTTELNLNNRSYNKQYCEIRNDGLWTLIQRRDNYKTLQNFSLTWFYYKMGFGDLNNDFWFGNDFISKLSLEKELILRIELEDFEGNQVWAEYSTFKLLSEEYNYMLIVDGYSGNASDSLLSHNNSLFSTFDRKNDEAPDCCPCAVSYGGGWWFNKCFESNLNGVYYRQPYNNEYFRGIIWENWLGNYSLKKTQMMVKSRGRVYSTSNSFEDDSIFNRTNMEIPYYEEP